jgi:S1-C subfamily serine protease
MAGTTSVERKSLGSWAAAAGVLVAYLTIFTTVSAHVSRSAPSEYGPVLAAFLSIALFRRLLRIRSESASEELFKAGPVKHYFASYGQALWRWFAVYVGLGIALSLTADSPESAGALFGALLAVMVIGTVFALDVPYRVRRRFIKSGSSSFKERNLGWIVFLVVVASLWAARYAPALTRHWLESRAAPTALEPRSAKEVFADAQKRIVMLESFNELGIPLGQGSGVILGKSPSTAQKGLFRLIEGTDILTNFHVIQNANYVVITTKDGASHLGAVIYFDESQDLAVLRAPFEMTFGDTRVADRASVGDRLFTISNPQGLGWSLSEGIVSRMPSGEDPFIQFTAPVSAGSSGGGVFNDQCDLIGIITAILPDSQNINFALYLAPIDEAVATLRQRAAFPFSSVDADDWKAGLFLTDDSDRVNREKYAARVALSTSFSEKRRSVVDEWHRECREARPPLTTEQEMSILDERIVQFFSREKDSIVSWRANYPNDPDAAVAHVEMLARLGRTDESAQEVKAALKRFPLDMDVLQEAASLLYVAQRKELVPELFEEIDDLLQSGVDRTHHFDDEWSRELFEAKETSRAISKSEKLERFQKLKMAWSP